MDFEKNFSSIRKEIEADDQVREEVLPLARAAVRKCSESIKQSHRSDFASAKTLLNDAYDLITRAKTALEKSAFLKRSRSLDTAYQELAEAANVLSILESNSLTSSDVYHIPSRAYLTGIADTIGEIRRAILEKLREGSTERASELLTLMESLFEELSSFDFPNALVPDLRRKCDVARGIIERTRGDVTTAVRQDRLITTLGKFDSEEKGSD